MCEIFFFRVLEKYYVGELVDNEMPVFPDRRYNVGSFVMCCLVEFRFPCYSEFYEVLKGRVEKYFKDNNIVSVEVYHMIVT